MAGFVNGKGKAEADAGTPAPVEVTAEVIPAASQSNGIARTSSTELARFMPVMDIEQAIARRDVLVKAMKILMHEGVDYGKVDEKPNSKPALLQPGADKLCNLFGLTIKYFFLEKVEDWTGAEHGGEPFFYYQIAAQVYRGEFLLAEGVGACHSWESKYRWRKAERTCPHCNAAAIIKGREEYGGGWLCFGRKGGCGAKFLDGDAAIEEQTVGRKPNPDILDSVNTILKIAYKRAKVSGTINGTSASEFFTQDVEDFTPPEEVPINTGGYAPGTREAAAFVAGAKFQAGDPSNASPWGSMRDMTKMFEDMRERVGEVAWRAELERYGWNSFKDIRNALDAQTKNAVMRKQVGRKAIECYTHLMAIARKDVA